jgi:hypothetical protein
MTNTNAAVEQRKRAAPRLPASAAQPFLATRKVPTIPGRTCHCIEEFSFRVWSITDKATTEIALSQERPFGYPAAFPLLWSELMQISLLRVAWLPHRIRNAGSDKSRNTDHLETVLADRNFASLSRGCDQKQSVRNA